MTGNIASRTPYPERNFELILCQRVVDGGRMVAANNAAVLLLTFFAVVGHVDNDGIFAFKLLDDKVYHRVVV